MPDPATWAPVLQTAATVVGTLGGSLGGYWFAGRNEARKDERAAERELRALRAASSERLDEQRHEVQRATFFELQDELVQLARRTAEITMHDQKSLREGVTGTLFVPEEMSTGFMEKVRAVQRLRSRVLDSNLREEIGRFVAVCSGRTVEGAKTHKEADERCERKIVEVNLAYESVVEKLGAHLRAEINRASRGGSTASIPGAPGAG